MIPFIPFPLFGNLLGKSPKSNLETSSITKSLAMSGADQQEARLGLSEVSDEISRVFFGKGIQSGRPSYSDGYQPGYGAPPALDPSRPGLGTRLYRGTVVCDHERVGR